MPLATDFLNSNYFRAEDLDPNVLIETTIVDVRPREFDDGTKLVAYTDHQGKGVVLNQGRLATMIAALGVDYTGWPGKQIIIRQNHESVIAPSLPLMEQHLNPDEFGPCDDIRGNPVVLVRWCCGDLLVGTDA